MTLNWSSGKESQRRGRQEEENEKTWSDGLVEVIRWLKRESYAAAQVLQISLELMLELHVSAVHRYVETSRHFTFSMLKQGC